MTMKSLISLLTITIFLFTSTANYAQNEKGKRDRKELWEKYRSEKIAFLTTNLDLSPEEAQKFWPVYNQKDKEESEAQMERRALEHKVRDAESNLSDEDIIALTRKFVATRSKEGKIAEKYNEEFLKILPPQKVLKLYQTENDFRMHMFRKYREQRRNGSN